VDVTCHILKNTPPKHQMELLFRMDQSALPERPMDTQLKLNVSNILNRKVTDAENGGENGGENGEDTTTYDKFFKPTTIHHSEEERRRNDERQALMQVRIMTVVVRVVERLYLVFGDSCLSLFLLCLLVFHLVLLLGLCLVPSSFLAVETTVVVVQSPHSNGQW
jgi:hypothetical protein